MTMKKIKNIKQLRFERSRLLQRQAELEKAIRYDWRDLKDGFKPLNITDQLFDNDYNNKEKNSRGFFNSIISSLTSKYFKRAGNKMRAWFK
jgi:hypothetical protein